MIDFAYTHNQLISWDNACISNQLINYAYYICIYLNQIQFDYTLYNLSYIGGQICKIQFTVNYVSTF